MQLHSSKVYSQHLAFLAFPLSKNKTDTLLTVLQVLGKLRVKLPVYW